MGKIIARQIQKHDLEVNWNKAINFTPQSGEIIVYDIEVDSNGILRGDLPLGRTIPYTYSRFKIGDGISNVNDLPFIEKPDWNQNDPMGVGYVQNRTHWTKTTISEPEILLEESTLEFVDEGGSGTYYPPTMLNLTEGAECTVTWDGVDYVCTCQNFTGNGIDMFWIGNAIALGEEDDGIPFIIMSAPAYGMTQMQSMDTVLPATHTVRIVSVSITQEIHKIDNKYIDAVWIAKEPIGYSTVELISETTQTVGADGRVYVNTSNANKNAFKYLEPSTSVTMTIDGVDYESKCTDLTAMLGGEELTIGIGDFLGAFGDILSVDNPYGGYYADSTGLFLYVYLTAGTHTIKLTMEKPIYEQLPNGYIANALDNIKSNLTFDNTPTQNSSNPVTSGGLYTKFKEIQTAVDTKAASSHMHSNYASTLTTTGSGNAITAISQSGNTITATKGSTFLTAHPTISTSADTTSTISPEHGNSFTAVDSITRDSNGHVTKVNTKTITIPDAGLHYISADSFTVVAGSSTSGAYLATKWAASSVDGITVPKDGMSISVRTPAVGYSGGILLSVDGGSNYYPIVRNVNTLVTTQYAAGSTLMLVFNSTQTASPYTTANTTETVTGCWQIADYDANTKTSAGTSNKTGTKMYLVGGTSQSSSGVTTYTNKNVYIGTDNCLYSGGAKVATASEVTAEIETAIGSAIAASY